MIKSTSVYFLSCADFAVGKTAIRCLHATPLTRSLWEKFMTHTQVRKSLIAALGVFLTVCFFGCNDILENDAGSASAEKGRLTFTVEKDARTILPVNMTESDIAKIVFSAEKLNSESGEYEDYSIGGDATKEWKSLSEMKAAALEVNVGTYNFHLDIWGHYASDDSRERIVQSASLSEVQISTGENPLSFRCEYVEYGRLSLKFRWDFVDEDGAENSPISKIGAALYKIGANGGLGDKVSGSEEDCPYFRVELEDGVTGSETNAVCEATYAPGDEIANGTYYIIYKVYDMEDTPAVINTISDIVKIHGYKTEETILLDLEKLNIPTAGADAALYVSGTGNDTAYIVDEKETEPDGTEEKPFESIDKACEKIIETGTPSTNWTIYIMGDVTGPHEGTNKAGSRTYSKDYGRSTISADVTSEHAKSILLTGYNNELVPLGEQPNPQDKINRGLTSSSATGSALLIETAVPVTITNLKITGGDTDNTSGGSDTYSQKGGGIAIAEGATVTLSDGAVIYKNRGYYGGGIYNAGTLYVYGSAVIGNTAQEQMPVKDAANYGEDGGGIYNVGNVYLGYSRYESETENTPEDWSGCISYNYSWRGGAINNRGAGKIVMRDGTIGHNQTVHGGGAAGGGGIYNYGSFTMSGGLIEYNYEGGNNGGGGVCNLSSSSYGTGVFTFTGGAIKSNTAGSGNNGVNGGGGVYNDGIMYVYGDAVIGDDSAETIAAGSGIPESCSNLAAGQGGGIYVATSGKLYMGYSAYTSETENTPAEWKGGIFYNYALSGGGGLGLAYGSSVVIHMNSGTIANNGAEKNGGAVYIGGDGFTISGTATIPAGNGEVKQSIYYNSSYSLNIADSLRSVGVGGISLIPSSDSAKTAYSSYQPVIKLTAAATNAGLTLSDVVDKFVIEPLSATATGIVTQWIIDPATGKVKQNIATFYVSANGSKSNDGLSASTPLPTIASAVAKMSDKSVDYTISLSGEILGTQVIADSEESQILANSITIKGKTNTSTTSVPADVLNANLGENEAGTALTVNTKVPVTLYDIAVMGGHGTEKDGMAIGGGLLICEGGTVSIEQNTRILQNTTYFGNASLSGYGAGVYVSKGAKLFVNSSSHITENTATHKGAGVYVADGGYLRTQQGSGSYITLNTFKEDVRDASGVLVSPCGGGVYLADGATYEMFGCYIRENAVPENGFGSGVYVSKTASFKMSGAAEVTVPNDVYLQDGAQVEIVDSVNAKLSARLTPELYPVDGGADVCLIKRTLDTASYTMSWSNVSTSFEITPQELDGGQKQYWYIDKSTAADATGKLVKQVGMGITVAIPTGLSNDIEVTVTSDGVPMTTDTKIPVSSNLVFTATEGMSSYTWTLDGEEVNTASSAAHIYRPDTSGWVQGSYVVYLEAKDSEGKYYSYTAQITVSE